jgi:hypothetical protein
MLGEALFARLAAAAILTVAAAILISLHLLGPSSDRLFGARAPIGLDRLAAATRL